jgi:hypothetical protein
VSREPQPREPALYRELTVARTRSREGAAHVEVMFFESPQIFRLPRDDPRFDELLERASFEEPAAPQARRAVIVVDVERISDSCGYGVPLMTFAGTRPHQDACAAKKLRTGGPGALTDYQAEKNAASIDGLPAVTGALSPRPR